MTVSNHRIRSEVARLYEELSQSGCQPSKIIPLRYPIAEEEFEIEQVIVEPVGMIERYILQAICKFGPCKIDDINNLLELDHSLIRDLISQLMKAGVQLSWEGELISADESLGDLLKQQKLKRTVKHLRTFIVDTGSGKLLPINYLDRNRNWIFPLTEKHQDPSGGKFARVRIGDRAINGTEALRRALVDTDTNVRVSLGIPDGGTRLTKPTYQKRSLSAVLAFAVVVGDEVKIYSAENFSIRLTSSDTSNLKYWQKVCENQGKFFDEPTSIEELADQLSFDLKGVKCSADEYGALLVTVDEPDKLWGEMDQLDQYAIHRLNDLKSDLVRGLHWNDEDFTICRIVAGDRKTAAKILILKGVEELLRCYRRRKTLQNFSIDIWWKEYQKDFLPHAEDDRGETQIDLSQLLLAADDVPDTNFLDWLEDVTLRKDAN